VLFGVVDEWDGLGLSVKCNVMCSLLGLRNKGVYAEGLAAIVKAAKADRDDWVRIMGSMMEPLVTEPPQNVELSDPIFLSTVNQINSLLKERGQPAWRPAFQAYLDNEGEQEVATPNDFFVVPSGKKLVALVPHENPLLLVPATAQLTASDSSRLAKRQTNPMSERKTGATLRGTSTLMEKKPYQQKKVVKALTHEQVDQLIKKEQLLDTKRQAQPIAVAATEQQEDLLAEAQEPQAKIAKSVMDDLTSLTSVVTGPAVPIMVPNSSNKVRLFGFVKEEIFFNVF
jgi:hypothetical protein